MPAFVAAALPALFFVGAAVSAGAAGVMTNAKLRRDQGPDQGHADPMQVIGILHWIMLLGWVGLGFWLFGPVLGAVLVAAGLILVWPSVALRLGRALVARFGFARLGRLSLAAGAVTTMTSVAVYAGSLSA